MPKTQSRPSITTIKSMIRSRSRMSQLAAESRSRLRASSRVNFGDDGGDGEEWLQAKDPVKPADQLDLTEEELKQEFTRILRAENPNAPDNIVRFNHKEQAFTRLATVEQCDIHFALDGNLVHQDSDEARRHRARRNIRSKRKPETVDSGTGPDGEEGGDAEGEDAAETEDAETADGEVEAEADGDGEAAEEPEAEVEEEAEESAEPKALRNQFNFSERASQTFNYTTKERHVATEPPPRSNFKGSCTQWEIYDTYVAEKARQDALKEKKKPHHEEKQSSADGPTFERSSGATEENASMWAASAKIVTLEGAKKIERMVNQNSFDDVLQDFKYWDDASDEVKPDEGSLLPLWTFVNEPTKKKHVTALCFNPSYPDMLTVGYGSYNFAKQQGGGIASFTMKNPSFPEYNFTTDSGVMCLDFHPEAVHLMVVGFYDGSVAVYDMHSKDLSIPTYKATALTGKHSDPVWQVKWQPDDLEKHKNFYSVSSDGRITSWTLRYAELHHHDVIRLTQQLSSGAAESGGSGDVEDITPPASGTCFAFNASSEHLFLVGTEEGKVHKCSKAYSSKFLSTFDAHHMAVYATAWNKFHPRVFATCSADWGLKIWDHAYPKCLFQFDLGNPVGDVTWSPYSATIFAAVTTDSRVHIFDLSKSKYEPICVQPIVKKGRLTHVEFNPIHPIVIVGDDRGSVSSLKLSPNLRKELSKKTEPAAQVEKLEKILESVKELNIQTGEPIAGN